MKSILGIGNALTDILAVLPDDTLLKKFHLPLGSMQHVDMETGDRIWEELKQYGVKYVPGGSAANTITCTAIFGMESGFLGKIGNDDLGNLFKSTMEQYGVKAQMLYSEKSSGRCMVFITGANAERTFADYMGATLELGPEDLDASFFEGYDYFHIEGYLVQNQELISKAARLAKAAGCIISIDMASYNVVESNDAFFHNLVENYVDIVFANESEAKAFTKMEPRDAIDELARHCKIAVVKVGKAGSMVKSCPERALSLAVGSLFGSVLVLGSEGSAVLFAVLEGVGTGVFPVSLLPKAMPMPAERAMESITTSPAYPSMFFFLGLYLAMSPDQKYY